MLAPADIEALADALAPRVAELLARRLGEVQRADRLLDTRELAPIIGFEPEWIRAHAAELGAIRIGNGPRPRLKFDPTVALAAVRERTIEPPPPRAARQGEPTVRPRRPRGPARRTRAE